MTEEWGSINDMDSHFTLPHILQTDPSAFRASYAVGNVGSFLVVNAVSEVNRTTPSLRIYRMPPPLTPASSLCCA